MSFTSSAVYFGESSVEFGGDSTVQTELDFETLGWSLQTQKANSCVAW